MNKPKRPVVLIVDDDKNTRDGLDRALRREWDVLLAESGERALQILDENEIQVMLSDVRMPGIDGITLMQRALAKMPGLICILLTAYGNVEVAVEAMKNGAYDFLAKPINLDHLDIQLKRAMRTREMESENINLRTQLDSKYGLENIIGNTRVMNELFEMIRQAAPTQATILIQGETGTGKELVAHSIHQLSSRSKGPFIAVHCASLSPTLIESELFGHEKGAFTGAIGRRKGRFENADGGTLFLDEISEIDAATQVKLLRILEERKFERVGGDETIEVDIRLITATNKDLKKLVEEGKFREDLFFRLDVVSVTIPPIRERADDIPLLCDQFVREFNIKHGKTIEGITVDAMNILSQYQWPGNVRELKNTIEKMVVLAGSKRLTARDVPVNIRNGVGAVTGSRFIAGDTVVRHADSLAEAEKKMIFLTLKKNSDNITKTARDLGVSRRTLHRKLNSYRSQE